MAEQYRRMTAKEIQQAKKFVKMVAELDRPQRFRFEVEETSKEEARGWTRQVSENVKGVCI